MEGRKPDTHNFQHMKLFNKFLIGAAALALWSCSNDEPGASAPGNSDGEVYARLSLSMNTRSATVDGATDTNSSDGFEIGQDSENNVNSVIVVLAQNVGSQANPTFEYITCSLSGATLNPDAVDAASKPTYVVRFQTQALNDLVKNGSADVYVFAYCNPVAQLRNLFLNADGSPKENVGQFTDEIISIADAQSEAMTTSIWSPNNFLMSNASLHVTTLPALSQLVLCDSEAKAFDLGTVDVSRNSARFDFASTTTAAGENTYEVKDVATGLPVANVIFDALALFNEAKDFYALPRVSADGQNNGAKLCGIETSNNWVVSPYAALKAATPFNFSAFEGKYLFPFSADGIYASNLNFTPFSALVADDSDENWNAPAGYDYKIWRYATENTIPKVESQIKGITTGVAFRAELKPLTNLSNERAKAVAEAMAAGNDLYMFDGILYGDKAAVQKAANAQPGSQLDLAYRTAFVPENLTNGDLNKSVNGFAIYRCTKQFGENHYYMYYYYYNRHNNNGQNTVMGPMEFDVVRNNVYKLTVDQVLAFGRPGNPGDDPDPENPNDPDESPKTYFKVSVRVLPWIVRINKIEF